MITLETVLGVALQQPQVMDHLSEALRSDVVVANPYYRRLVEFADDFLTAKRKLPASGDWEVWLMTLPEGTVRGGTTEALGRLLAQDPAAYDPVYFAEQVVVELQKGAAQVVRARLNELPQLAPETLLQLAAKVEAVRGGGLQGLARLEDIETWSQPVREDEYVGTGFPTLNKLIGGWGKELWLLFADSGVGKSILLQNFAVNAAVRGKHVLHITLELGLRSQIHRYYRQIAEADRAEFAQDLPEVKRRLQHWFRLAKGSVHLLEFDAHAVTIDDLKRTVERVNRATGTPVDVVVLDYLDLVAPGRRSGRGGAYEDLGTITHETRSMCPEFGVTVLSASQAVRRPEKAGRLTVRDMGDSYQKVRGADGIMSLVQTDTEEEVHQGRLGLLKVRDHGGRGREIALYINRDLALIQELDHPNVRQLMARLGHLPAPPGPAPAKATP